MTAVALPTLFNAIPQPNGMVQIMHGTTNLFRLAKDQGFQTYWFTAQARNEMNILNLIGGKWIDKITFPEAFGVNFQRFPTLDAKKLVNAPKMSAHHRGICHF